MGKKIMDDHKPQGMKIADHETPTTSQNQNQNHNTHKESMGPNTKR